MYFNIIDAMTYTKILFFHIYIEEETTYGSLILISLTICFLFIIY